MVDGAVTDLEMVAKDKTNGITGPYLAKLRQGFALDAWLANWDVAGEGNENPWANIVRGTDGNPHRIDVGGALLFRGMGGPKGDTFGEKVVEWETMRDLSRGRRHAQLFDDMSPAELLASANRVKAITPAQIRKMVQARGMDSELADLLIARRKDLLSRLAVKVKPSPKWKTATTGREALQAAPAKVGGPGGVKALTGLGMPNDRAYLSASAFEDYKGEDYGPINRALLKAGGKPLDPDLTPSVRNQIDRIRDGFKFSKLKEDVIVYRGERAPARSFPDGTWSLAGGMEGMEWTGHNFGSSSASKRTAVSFALGHTSAPKHQAQATIFRILVPKGTPAVELGGGSNDGEEELLLGEGLTYRVVKDHGVAYEPDSDINIRQIDIEVVKK
jgi:ADP-ribosyltransferase exoenzyme